MGSRICSDSDAFPIAFCRVSVGFGAISVFAECAASAASTHLLSTPCCSVTALADDDTSVDTSSTRVPSVTSPGCSSPPPPPLRRRRRARRSGGSSRQRRVSWLFSELSHICRAPQPRRHTKGRAPVCRRSCAVRFHFFANARAHPGCAQTYARFDFGFCISDCSRRITAWPRQDPPSIRAVNGRGAFQSLHRARPPLRATLKGIQHLGHAFEPIPHDFHA